jgi:putative oxidoreductase
MRPHGRSKELDMLKEPSGRFTSLAYAAMRFVVAALLACHGAQKLFGVFGGHVAARGSLPFFAGVIEIVAGPLIAIGLLTRIAAFIASGEMAVAYFKQHFPKGFWPIENKGELAVAFCFVFLFIFAYGPGRISVDRAFRRSPR